MDMTNEELNRYVHEARGEKWYPEKTEIAYSCENCKVKIMRDVYPVNPNYLEHGKAWGKLLRWAMEQEWWDKFSVWLFNKKEKDYSGHEYIGLIHLDYITNPKSLPEHIVSYLEEVKDG